MSLPQHGRVSKDQQHILDPTTVFAPMTPSGPGRRKGFSRFRGGRRMGAHRPALLSRSRDLSPQAGQDAPLSRAHDQLGTPGVRRPNDAPAASQQMGEGVVIQLERRVRRVQSSLDLGDRSMAHASEPAHFGSLAAMHSTTCERVRLNPRFIGKRPRPLGAGKHPKCD
jgi:hypothetical protein